MLNVTTFDTAQLLSLMKRYNASYNALHLVITAECYINFRWHFLQILYLFQRTPQKQVKYTNILEVKITWIFQYNFKRNENQLKLPSLTRYVQCLSAIRLESRVKVNSVNKVGNLIPILIHKISLFLAWIEWSW